MNVGKTKLYITPESKPVLGYVVIHGIVLMDKNQQPLMGTGFAPLRVKHGDRIHIDIVDPAQEEK